MVVDISYGEDYLCLINIYHDTPDKKHHLQHVFTYKTDPLIHTLVVGDFNTHGPGWSLPGATMSPWAAALEDWFDDNNLALCNPPGVATWEGRKDQRSSVLDLVLLNARAIASDQFSDVYVSFPLSLGSDHAALFLSWTPIIEIPQLSPTTLPGFVIDDDLHDTWAKTFAAIPNPVITSSASLIIAANCLLEDITETCAPLFSRRRSPDPQGARWWSTTCSAALAMVQSASPADRRETSKAFAKVLTDERRAWADNFLHYTTSHKLWEATHWRHGRRATRIPPFARATAPSLNHPKTPRPSSPTVSSPP